MAMPWPDTGFSAVTLMFPPETDQERHGGEELCGVVGGLTRLPFHRCALEAKNQVISLI
jgi:hypothetical protein